MLDAEERCNRALADANEAEEYGDHRTAAKLFNRAQNWLDRYNLLAGNADKPPPKR